MIQPVSAPPPSFEPSLFLAGAIALVLTGLTLVLYSVRVKRQELLRRVDLVAPLAVLDASQTDFVDRPVLGAALLGASGGKMSERGQREIQRLLSMARIPAEFAVAAFLFARLSSAVLASLAAFALVAHFQLLVGKGLLIVLVLIVFGIAGWFVPAVVIGRLAGAHAKAAAFGLPDALELLVVCIEAGMALEDAIDRVAMELAHSHPDLAAELALMSADLKILPSRDQALKRLAERVDAPSVHSFVTTLSQTLRFGTPLAQAMRVVSAEMRNDSLLEMEERANRLPTLMTIPMMLFIMPTIFLSVGGPAALKVIDVFLR
jgi:tight adherence protein C